MNQSPITPVKDKRGTPKLIHLPDDIIKLLTIQAVKSDKGNFKHYVEDLLRRHVENG
jgi:hypothetical protein